MIISSVDEGSLPLSRVDKDGQMTGTCILMCLQVHIRNLLYCVGQNYPKIFLFIT